MKICARLFNGSDKPVAQKKQLGRGPEWMVVHDPDQGCGFVSGVTFGGEEVVAMLKLGTFTTGTILCRRDVEYEVVQDGKTVGGGWTRAQKLVKGTRT